MLNILELGLWNKTELSSELLQFTAQVRSQNLAFHREAPTVGPDRSLPEMMLLPSLIISMAWQVTLGTMMRRSSLFSGVCHTRISFLEQVANTLEDPLENSERRDHEEGRREKASFFVRS